MYLGHIEQVVGHVLNNIYIQYQHVGVTVYNKIVKEVLHSATIA